MRSSLARAAVIGSTALLFLGPAVSVAQAQPDEPGVSDRAAHLPAELADAVQRDLHLSPDQYLERSELAQRLAEFAKTARDRFPDSFAGVWIDQAGTPTVGLAAKDRDTARTEVEKAGFTGKDVTHSQNQLDATRTALSNWVDKLPKELAQLVRGVTVDIASNDVVLRVDNTAVDLFTLLPPFLQEAARVVLGPAIAPLQPVEQPQPTAQYSSDAFLAGDPYASYGGGIGLKCSLGFNAIDAGGAPVNISAGHCDPSRTFAGTEHASQAYSMIGDSSGPMIGTFEKTDLDGIDYSILRPTADAAQRFVNNGVRVPNAAPLSITGTADPVIGAPVCKAGNTSGFNCGVVTAVHQVIPVGQRTLNDGFATDLCALQGDSGGPIVTGTLALGISSASNVGNYSSCDVAGVATTVMGETPELFATPVNAILADNPGLTIRTS
ncbi:S1 family peptidase [Prescottella subtropica]|uniref:S1 family peptidase n=1 Tax=Prescottella subtropica TaxID=2545757 RepID=UPI0010F8E534|nr:S1 family peptidase [Prescottella subtropica]